MASWKEIAQEPRRLAAVRKTNLLDTPPERCFDELTQLAAEKLNVPAAFISLIDTHSSFYKSCFGFGESLTESRRLEGETFCHHAIASDGLLVIDDTRADPKYASVPTVLTLGVAAYLGVPLHSASGEPLGAFAVIDKKPRRWTRKDISTACLLARAALREIESRQHERAAPPPVHPELSPREREVMLRLVAGQRLKEIASELGVQVQTVATHRQRLLRKLGLDDNRGLYRYALRTGLLDWSEQRAD